MEALDHTAPIHQVFSIPPRRPTPRDVADRRRARLGWDPTLNLETGKGRGQGTERLGPRPAGSLSGNPTP